MRSTGEPRLVERFRAFAVASGFAVALLGGLVLLGWVFDVALLKSVLPGRVSMKANAAVGFVLAGAALCLLAAGRSGLRRRRAAQLCAGVVALLGALTLAEHILGWNLGIDQLLFREAPGTLGTSSPGRMAPNGALSFVLLGLALLLIDKQTRGGHRPAQALALFAGLIALLGLVGYAYGAKGLYGVGAYTDMALHTAAGFLVLSTGLLAARPERGWVALVTSEGPASMMMRRLLGPVLLLPIAVGWLILEGRRADLADRESGLALFAVATVVSLSILLLGSAKAVDRAETERHRADAQREALRHRSEEMEEQNQRIQEAGRLKGEFLANMSHELRTPLNAILGFSQLMHDGKVGPVSEQHKEFLGDILSSGRHLLQLVNDVLDLAKVESGKMEFRPEALELPRLVGEVRDILRTLAAQKRVFLEAQIDPTLTDVVADPRALKQVLYNYLSNALKFTPEEGRVTVRMDPEGSEHLRLEVEDTGVGIRPEDLGRLFVEFQQLDSGVAKSQPGTGLGLALTRRIVEAQGGHVGVRSTPGTGSVFFAVLPRRPREPALESPPSAAHPRPAEPLVLVIEDDSKGLAWLETTLGGAGYAVEAARNGGEALARCRGTAFDAIVLDILMPDMSGWDALRAIRAMGLNRDTPTIVSTVVAEKGAGVGFTIHDFLTKPVRAEDLLASLTRAGVPPGFVRPILVLEDEPAQRRLMETLLSQLGYRALARPDGASGLLAAAEDPPLAVILDLAMPGMDGFEFLKRFRKLEVGRRTPVIVWTARDVNAEVRSRLAASAQAIVEKARGGEALIEELRAHVLPPRARRG